MSIRYVGVGVKCLALVKMYGNNARKVFIGVTRNSDVRMKEFPLFFFFPFLNLLKPTFHVMHQQFNIQQLYVLPTLFLCVLYLSENKQRLVPLTA